jgi:hypothetical protein
VAAASGVAVLAFALMTGWSAPLWAILPVLSSVQFPWRLLAVLTPAAALLAACAAARAAAAAAPLPARVLGGTAVVLLAANLFVAWRDVVARAHLDPAWAARLAGDPWAAQDAAEYRPGGAPATGFPRLPRAQSLVPGGWAVVRAWGPERRAVTVEAPADGRLRVATFRYAGWRATVDGRPARLETGPSGVIEVEVPAGRHVVEVVFGTTPHRRAGALLSATALLVLAGWAAWGWTRKG